MTSIIKFTLKELNTLINDANSCVSKKSVIQNIAFQPWCLSNMKDSVEKILDYKIGKFDKDLDGIILSYKNVKILDDLCAIRQDSSEIYSDVQADLFVFQPRVGATLHGVINKTSVTHLGILVHRVFNVVIPRPSNEPGNKWIGAQLSVGQKISFKIVVLDLFGALPYIRGCLDENSLPIEDLDNSQIGDEIDGLESHVNFAGTKPKSAKTVNIVKKSPKNVDSPYSVSSNKSLKAETRKEKNKRLMGKKYVDSDSDSISDVDDELMQTQTSLIEKIMSLDKCQRASGVKPSFATNSIGITKIDKSKPPKTNFIDVRKLKIIKSLHKPSENIKVDIEELNGLKSKSIVSPSLDKKSSRISDDFKNISVIAKSPNKHVSIDESSMIKSPKKPKSLDSKISKRKMKANGNQNNITGDSLVTTSTPFPIVLDKAEKNGSQKEYVLGNKDTKKKLSFSNVSCDGVAMRSSSDATFDSKEADDKKTKISTKLKQDSNSFINIDNSIQNVDFDTDVSQSSSTSKRKQKKRDKSILDSYDSTSSIIMNTPLPKMKSNMRKTSAVAEDIKISKHTKKIVGIDKIISTNDSKPENSVLDGSCDSTSKNKKRKRKSSDSSINMSGITSDDTHRSDVSNKTSHRKKRRKIDEADPQLPKDCYSKVHFIAPANVDGNSDRDLSSSDQRKHKKEKPASSQESHNGISIDSTVTINSSDEISSKKKHAKRLERRKSVCVQEILSQFESDPSLLEEIEMLLKARTSKQK